MRDSQKHDLLLDSELCSSILLSLPIGVAIITDDFNIACANYHAQKILGSSAAIKNIFAAERDSDNWPTIAAQITRTIQAGQQCDFDGISFSTSSAQRLLNLNFAPLDPPRDDILCILTIEDTTDFALMEQQLATAQKHAAIGKMAAKVAHELNNPMDGILRYMSLAIRIVEAEHMDKPLEYLQSCRKALLRMVQIVSERLEYSRTASANYGQSDPETLLEEALKANEARLTPIKVVKQYDLQKIKTGGPNLFQVFCNLVKNSAQAMPDGGTLTIKTSRQNEKAVIEITDTGPGIAVENIEKIFEPFFTTKAAAKGTGLGLAVCKDIVVRYGGTITAQNRLPAGCVFTITLPINAQELQ